MAVRTDRTRLGDNDRTRGHDPARSRRRRRHPPRRRHAPPAPAAGAPTPTPLVGFFERLSDREPLPALPRHPRTVDRRLVEPFLDPDWVERGRARRHAREGGEERIVALASYARLRDPRRPRSRSPSPTTSRGAASARGCSSSSRARAADGGHRRASSPRCWPTNRAMLAVFADAGFEVGARARAAARSRCASRSRRPRRSARASRSATTSPSSPRCAVLRARERRRDRRLARGAGRSAASSSATSSTADFAGAAYPVNRSGEPVAGVRALRARSRRSPTRSTSPSSASPAARVLDAADGGARGRACARSASSRPASPRRAPKGASARSGCSRSCARTARGSSARTASASRSAAARLNATFAPRALPPGRIGFSSQSGALGLALLETAAERGLGFSAFVSIGNKADVSSNDLLEWWEDDPETDVVLLYLESFGNPRKFARARAPRRAPRSRSSR